MSAAKRRCDLQPSPENPRRMSDAARGGLAASMAEFGDISSIVYNERSQRLVCGHQRTGELPSEAKLRVEHRVKDAAGTTGYGSIEALGTRWPVRFVDWPVAKEKAANVAANSPLLAGEFTDALRQVIADIEAVLPELVDSLNLGAIQIGNADAQATAAVGEVIPEMELQPFEHYDYLLVLARNLNDWNWLCERLKIVRVNASPIPGKKKVGLGRAIEAARLIVLLKEKESGDGRPL